MNRRRRALVLLLMLMIHECFSLPSACPVKEEVTRHSGYCATKDHAMFQSYRHFYSCCEDTSPCVGSGMTSRFLLNFDPTYRSPVYARDFKVAAQYKSMFGSYGNPAHRYIHEFNTNGRQFLCPIPIGFLWLESFSPIANQAPPSEYMPVDYQNMDSTLNTCSKNSDCGSNQFCGHVINFSYDQEMVHHCSYNNMALCINDDNCNSGTCKDQKAYTLVDKTQKFCYKDPSTPAGDSKLALVKDPNSISFALCDTDNDCNTASGQTCHTSLASAGKTWTGLVDQQRKSFAGICVETKPVAFLYSNIYEQLTYGQKLAKEAERYFPVDMDMANYDRSKLQTCEKNSDCGDNFCGESVSLSLSKGYRDDKNKFCYQTPDPPSSEVSFIAKPNKVGLIPCDENRQCGPEGFCYKQKRVQYAKFRGNGKDVELMQGLCVEAEALCGDLNGFNEPFAWEKPAALPNGNCEQDSDCDGHGKTREGSNVHKVFQSTCMRNQPIDGVGLCCYRETEQCKRGGTVVKPEIRCGKDPNAPNYNDGPFLECYGGRREFAKQLVPMDMFCDLDINQCCHNPAIAFCPDKQTPLFLEDECTGYDPADENSGTCSKPQSICRLGHCCPNVFARRHKRAINSDETYITNSYCIRGATPPPTGFHDAYCDPELERVVLFIPNKKYYKSDGEKACNTDSDCSSDYSKLCIKMTNSPTPYCYWNPRYIIIDSIIRKQCPCGLVGYMEECDWHNLQKSIPPQATADPIPTPPPPPPTPAPVTDPATAAPSPATSQPTPATHRPAQTPATTPSPSPDPPQSALSTTIDPLSGKETEDDKLPMIIILVVAIFLVILAIVIGCCVLIMLKKKKKKGMKQKKGKKNQTKKTETTKTTGSADKKKKKKKAKRVETSDNSTGPMSSSAMTGSVGTTGGA